MISCLAKDTSALVYLAESQMLPQVAAFWRGTLDVTKYQMIRIVDLIGSCLGNNCGLKRIAILGFAYKKNIKDCRNSPAIDLVHALTTLGASIVIYDPQVPKDRIVDVLDILHSSAEIEICKTVYEACAGARAIVLITDWDEFGSIDWDRVASNMEEPRLVYDTRNALAHKPLKASGLQVEAVGKTLSTHPSEFHQIW